MIDLPKDLRREIVVFERRLQRLSHHNPVVTDLLLRFNRFRRQLGVKTSLGPNGCIVNDPHGDYANNEKGHFDE